MHKMLDRRAASLSLLCVAAALPALSAPFPTGPARQVNEFTTGRQLNAAVTVLPGGAVVVWEDEQTGADRTVEGRRLKASGFANGSNFQVSTATTEDRTSPDVAALPGGEFLVVWEDDIPGDDSISGRHFDSSGTPGSVFAVAGPDSGINAYNPSVVSASETGFAVVWQAYESAADESTIQARLYDQAGAADGVAVPLETSSPGDFFTSLSVAERTGQGFLSSWRNGGASGDELRARAYTAGGAPDGAFVSVTTGSASESTITGLDDDGFLVVWSPGNDGLGRQRFQGNGGTGSFIDLSDSTQNQRTPVATPLPNERAAVAWIELAGGGQPAKLQVQIVAADDQVEASFTVDTSTLSLFSPDLAYDTARAELIVTWTRRGGPGADQEEVYIRRYALEGVFGDDFESGDTSSWSGVVSGP